MAAGNGVEMTLLTLSPAGIEEAFNQGLLIAGQEIVALAGVLAPVDTGELARSGKAEITDEGVEVSFGNEIEDARAVVQEFGSVFQPAQPYLFPAIRNVDVEFFVKTALNEVLNKARKSV